MNYKEYCKIYCRAYNWVNNGLHKVYCSPHCPHFIGLSKRNKNNKITLIPLCEYDEERLLDIRTI
jgi:hypothetical protein